MGFPPAGGGGSVTFGPASGPVAVGGAENDGTSVDAPRADHQHAFPAAAAGAGATTSTPGDAESDGAAASAARSDHRHARADAYASTVVGPDAYGAASSVGSSTTLARADHNHGLPAAPAVPAAATTTTGPDAFGAAAAVGVSTAYARADHDHGLPANPVTAAAVEGLFTAAGQLFVGTGAGTGELLPVGADTDVLTVSATGTVAWGALPATGGVTSFNGGTGAITQADGYGIIDAGSNPPAPAVALTSDAGALAANVALVASTASVLLTTASLAPGTWLLTVAALYSSVAAGEEDEIWVQAGTATASFSGPQDAFRTESSGGYSNSLTFACEVTVTVAGTLQIMAESSQASTIRALGVYGNLPATGYTAVRIA